MTDIYEPTDEQIEALLHDAFEAEAMFDSDDANGVWVAEARWDAVKPGLARHIREHPAFQSIIRAAQAEAWEQGQHDMARSFTRPLDDRGMRLAIRNPYRIEKGQTDE